MGLHSHIRGLWYALCCSLTPSCALSLSRSLSLTWRANLASTPCILQICFSMFCDSILCYLHFNSILLWGRLEIQPLWNVMEISHFYWSCQLGKVKQSILYWWLLLNLVKLLSLSSWEKSNLPQNLKETSNSSSLLLWGKNLEVDFRSKSPKSDSLWSEQIESLNFLVTGHVRNNSGWLFLS